MRASCLPVSDLSLTLLQATAALDRFCIRSVADARRSLERFKFTSRRPTFSGAVDELQEGSRLAQLAEVLRELGLDQDPSLTAALETTDDLAYATAAIALLGRDTSLETDIMEQDYLNGEELWLRPSMLGLNALWDEEFELNFEEPDQSFEADDRLITFLACLNLGVDGETWAECNRYFGWRIAKPPVTDGNFDSDIFDKMLADMGLGDFLAACDVAWGYSGNLFFAWDYQSDPLDLTADNVRMLNDAYADAKITLEKSRACCQKVKRKRGILRQICAAWQAAFVIRERVRV